MMFVNNYCCNNNMCIDLGSCICFRFEALFRIQSIKESELEQNILKVCADSLNISAIIDIEIVGKSDNTFRLLCF